MEYRNSQAENNNMGLDHECAVLNNLYSEDRWLEHRNTLDHDI